MYTPAVSLKTIPNSKPKLTKCFQTAKTAHKPYPLGRQIPARVLTPFMSVRDQDHV